MGAIGSLVFVAGRPCRPAASCRHLHPGFHQSLHVPQHRAPADPQRLRQVSVGGGGTLGRRLRQQALQHVPPTFGLVAKAVVFHDVEGPVVVAQTPRCAARDLQQERFAAQVRGAPRQGQAGLRSGTWASSGDLSVRPTGVEKAGGGSQRSPAGHLPAHEVKPWAAMTCRYHNALSLGMRCCVPKSTQTIPKRCA